MAGAYDTAGMEEQAASYYEQALAVGLSDDILRRCYLQYGSTLRNLDRIEDSLEIFSQALMEFPESLSLQIFAILTLHAQGKYHTALSRALSLIMDNIDSAELQRYEIAIRGNAAYIASLD